MTEGTPRSSEQWQTWKCSAQPDIRHRLFLDYSHCPLCGLSNPDYEPPSRAPGVQDNNATSQEASNQEASSSGLQSGYRSFTGTHSVAEINRRNAFTVRPPTGVPHAGSSALAARPLRASTAPTVDKTQPTRHRICVEVYTQTLSEDGSYERAERVTSFITIVREDQYQPNTLFDDFVTRSQRDAVLSDLEIRAQYSEVFPVARFDAITNKPVGLAHNAMRQSTVGDVLQFLERAGNSRNIEYKLKLCFLFEPEDTGLSDNTTTRADSHAISLSHEAPGVLETVEYGQVLSDTGSSSRVKIKTEPRHDPRKIDRSKGAVWHDLTTPSPRKPSAASRAQQRVSRESISASGQRRHSPAVAARLEQERSSTPSREASPRKRHADEEHQLRASRSSQRLRSHEQRQQTEKAKQLQQSSKTR